MSLLEKLQHAEVVRRVSASAVHRIAAAQRARWAKLKAQAKAKAKAK